MVQIQTTTAMFLWQKNRQNPSIWHFFCQRIGRSPAANELKAFSFHCMDDGVSMSFDQAIGTPVFTGLAGMDGRCHQEIGLVIFRQVGPHGFLIHFVKCMTRAEAELHFVWKMHPLLLPLNRVAALGHFIATDVARKPALVRTIALELLEVDSIAKLFLKVTVQFCSPKARRCHQGRLLLKHEKITRL